MDKQEVINKIKEGKYELESTARKSQCGVRWTSTDI
jgi:hypothetical protein